MTVMMILRCIDEWFTSAWGFLLTILLITFLSVEVVIFLRGRGENQEGKVKLDKCIDKYNDKYFKPHNAELQADLCSVKIRLPK
mmetsp:Transcript_23897/g.3993  ORF Transcript_23897/g.3993 Transcript_23897/m.3993 type:complete len:84 (+) Transcript_23897:476-727(+)